MCPLNKIYEYVIDSKILLLKFFILTQTQEM